MNIPKDQEQQILLQIVETWRPSESPEYRGFRCANCQQYKNKAWYHWVNSEAYKLPIHMCDDTCEPQLQQGIIQVDQSKRQKVNRSDFGAKLSYSKMALQKFSEIVGAWPEYKEPELKEYTCDACNEELLIDQQDGMRKGYHVWWKMPDGKTLAELHFHRDCAHAMSIYGKGEVNN